MANEIENEKHITDQILHAALEEIITIKKSWKSADGDEIKAARAIAKAALGITPTDDEQAALDRLY